ncbi:hypothetical protein DsansV1_C09g0091461 [Dioscorea sansibarensis]
MQVFVPIFHFNLFDSMFNIDYGCYFNLILPWFSGLGLHILVIDRSISFDQFGSELDLLDICFHFSLSNVLSGILPSDSLLGCCLLSISRQLGGDLVCYLLAISLEFLTFYPRFFHVFYHLCFSC